MDKKTTLTVVNIILTGIILIYLINTQSNTPREGDFMNSLKTNLQNHEEFKGFQWEYPRVTLLTSNILDVANQRGIELYNNAQAGDLLLEFTGASVIYNYKDDEIVDVLVFETIPQDILLKLTAHKGLESYKNIRPDVIKITQQNINNLMQQIDGLDETKIGNYIINYQDLVILYDYTKDIIIDSTRFEAIPQDLLLKLTAHEGMEQYKDIDPFKIIIVKEENFKAIKQQIADLDVSHVDSYIVSYPDNRVIIYNYANDAILINQVLQPAAETQPNE